GGAEGDRPPDLRIANATLSQLSYGPVPGNGRGTRGSRRAPAAVYVGSRVAVSRAPPGPGQAFGAVAHRRLDRYSLPARRSTGRARMDVIVVPLLNIVFLLIRLYIWVLIISAILSWLVAFNVVNTRNRFVYTVMDFLWRITEPALRPIRRILPNLGGIDISPVILILILMFVQDV